MMKLYIMNGAPNARKCQAVVNHLGLDADIVRMDFFDGSLKQEDYLNINPNGRVPALVDGDLTLFESEAINMYLCTVKSENNTLFSPQLRPQIMQWVFWSVNHYNRHLVSIVWEAIIKPNFLDEAPDETVIEESSKLFHSFAAVLDDHLNDRQFMVGEDWTLADYSIGHLEPFVDALPVDIKKYENIYAFYERLRNNKNWMDSAVPPEKMGRAA